MMQPAARPVIASRDGKLLVVNAAGVRHLPRTGFPSLLHRNDLIVANDAATLPASLAGVHVSTGSPIEVRLAGRQSLEGSCVRFVAVVFGAGDFRTPTEHRPLPPPLAPGDELRLGAAADDRSQHGSGARWTLPTRTTRTTPRDAA